MTEKNSNQTKCHYLRHFILAFTCLMFLFSANAFAEEYDDYQLDELVITASKRPRKLQEVPISVMALPGDLLENQGVASLEDMGTMVSGLEIVSGGDGSLKLSVRGVTNMAGGLESTAAIGYYLDEVPISAMSNAMPEIALWDVARVEVLRGPQGTLFGEGSMAGTIRVIPNKPDSSTMEISGKVATEFYSTHLSDSIGKSFKAMLNVPVIENKLAFRILAGSKESAGWIDVPALDLEDTNSTLSKNFRLAALYTPTDQLKIDASLYWAEDDIRGVGSETIRGELDPTSFDPGPIEIQDVDSFKHTRTIANLTVEYDFEFASLVSASSYFKNETETFLDLSIFLPGYFAAMEGNGYQTEDPLKVDLFTQELRLVSSGDKIFDWTVGGFYKDSARSVKGGMEFDMYDSYGIIQQYIWGYDPADIIPNLHIVSPNLDLEESNSSSYALFADGDYELGKQFSIGAGMRYFSEKRDYKLTSIVPSSIFGSGTTDKIKAEDTAFTPKIVLNYKPNDKILLFVKGSRGFRSGGTNSLSVLHPEYNVSSGYTAEILDSYELGIKTSLWAGVLMNAYVYYNDWKDLQLSMTTEDGRYMFRDNVGTARSIGAEFELMAPLPIEGLSINLNASYINAEITEDVIRTDGAIAAEKGNKIPYAPEFKGTLGAQYVRKLTDSLYGVLQASYTYKTETYNDPTNNELEKNEAMQQIDATLSIESELWNLTLFGSNLLDRDDTTYRQAPIGILPDMVYNTFIRPRTIGLRLTYNF